MTLASSPDRFRSALPVLDNPLFDGFWQGTREGEIRMPRCEDCGEFHWYPLYRCPHCGGAAIKYAPAGNRATLFSWAIIRRVLHPDLEGRLGEVVALVVPEHAPRVRLVTNLVGVDDRDLRKGLNLRPEFVEASPQVVLHLFGPERDREPR